MPDVELQGLDIDHSPAYNAEINDGEAIPPVTHMFS
jgi:hypothetical protein